MSRYRRTTAKISKTTRVLIELLETILRAYRQLRLPSSRLAIVLRARVSTSYSPGRRDVLVSANHSQDKQNN